METKTALAIILLTEAAILVGVAVILKRMQEYQKREIRTQAGIQTRLTAERKRDYKKVSRKK